MCYDYYYAILLNFLDKVFQILKLFEKSFPLIASTVRSSTRIELGQCPANSCPQVFYLNRMSPNKNIVLGQNQDRIC